MNTRRIVRICLHVLVKWFLICDPWIPLGIHWRIFGTPWISKWIEHWVFKKKRRKRLVLSPVVLYSFFLQNISNYHHTVWDFDPLNCWTKEWELCVLLCALYINLFLNEGPTTVLRMEKGPTTVVRMERGSKQLSGWKRGPQQFSAWKRGPWQFSGWKGASPPHPTQPKQNNNKKSYEPFQQMWDTSLLNVARQQGEGIELLVC